jgi:hypothetical protein
VPVTCKLLTLTQWALALDEAEKAACAAFMALNITALLLGRPTF